jgi:DNA-binding PadR family transcriptional regulator
MIEELKSHGYEISAGTLYPIFHRMEESGLLKSEKVLVDGKQRKYYSITEAGEETLELAREKIGHLSHEIE